MRPSRRLVFLVLFLAGAGLRAVDLWHPVDGTVRESWRECDMASIARNYYREDPRFLYPRIDWRGTGPGYVEMELPVTPWATSVLYRVFGLHEVAGRVLVYAFALLTLVVFFRLALYLLPPNGAVAASLFFALSPLAVRISNTLQPEGLMFLTYILAVLAFIRWLDTGRWRDYALTATTTAFTILAKANTAHIGILFAILLLRRDGWTAFRRVRVWALALLSLAPPLLWYAYARGFWIHYGNSLGLSNEYHWIGWDFFTDPSFIRGIVISDLFYVWMPAGVLVALFGVIMRFRERSTQIALTWLAAVFAFYVLASRSMGSPWALYYHVASVPSVALLFGVGTESLLSLSWRPRLAVAAPAVGAALIAVLAFIHRAHLELGFGAGERLPVAIAGTVVAFALLIVFARRRGALVAADAAEPTPLAAKLVVLAMWFFVPLTLALQLREVVNEAHPRQMQASYACARQFAPLIPPRTLILASGANCAHADGTPVAYNAPFMFYWLDRKGFSVCNQDQSLSTVAAFARKGARFYVAAKGSLETQAGFEHALRATYPVVRECADWLLFDLSRQLERTGKAR